MLRLWEVLRATAEDDEEKVHTASEKKSAYAHKYPTVEKLLQLMEPKIATLLKTPTGSRVLQSMIKYGSAAHVSKVMKWLSQDFSLYATDAYAHFVVMSLIRHAPHDTFKSLLASLIPNVAQLITHKFGIETLHSAYSSKWCSLLDKQLLLLAIFKENVSVMKRWEGYPVLEDVLRKNASLRKRLLSRLFDLSDKLVSQKDSVQFPFVQRLVHAYVVEGTKDEVSELCDTLRPHLPAIATSKEGAPLASLAFSLTEPKKRKEILRGFQEKLGEITTSKYGAPVVARLFDLLYDPQILTKYLVSDMVKHIGQIINSPYGYLVFMHLLTPEDERKKKFLLPNWWEHNLYSLSNKEWNHHTWLTPSFEVEVVEICSKPAAASHLVALPLLVEGFLAHIANPANKEKANRHHVFLLAREILHVVEVQPLYRTALNLSAEKLATLQALAGQKEDETAPSKSVQKTKPGKHVKRSRSADESDGQSFQKKKKKKTV
ncbi:pumilio like proteiny domain family member 6 [Strigomonas culicis]|nr:pumilio like proteiny domain family member 6 [Strigomonas culicis]|eukprot:EPY34150.1 pumilio like proteiny domain family member 6 [Strigomonas culicis]